MKYTIAISTINDNLNHIEISKFPIRDDCEILIIHQVTNDKVYNYKCILDIYSNVKIVNSNIKGLSNSRNLAIDNASGDYLIFSDDDNYYEDNILYISDKVIENNPQKIGFVFKITDGHGNDFKKYSPTSKEVKKRDALRVSSLEMLINKHFLKSNDIKFDSNLGLGTSLPACEQPVFINDILNKRGRVIYLPIDFAIHPLENSGDDFYSASKSLARKYAFQKIWPLTWRIYSILFFLKKIKHVPVGFRTKFFKDLIL